MGISFRGPRMVLVQAALTLFICIALDAEAATVILQWTAPGDDGVVGTAAEYDLRYSNGPITAQNFLSATPVPSVPRPRAAGYLEMAAASVPDGPLWFALRTRDEAGNWSAISNVAQIGVVLAVDPGRIAEPQFSNPWPSPARARTTFHLALPRQDEVRIEILDVTGRAVKTLANDLMPAGESRLTWDLRDRFGGRVTPGVYFARASFLGRQWVRRVVVVQ